MNEKREKKKNYHFSFCFDQILIKSTHAEDAKIARFSTKKKQQQQRKKTGSMMIDNLN